MGDAEAKSKAREYYTKAMELAEAQLSPINPTRLGLALNLSICYYEILNEPEQACRLANKAFEEGMEKRGRMREWAVPGGSDHIMGVLRHNLNLWTSGRLPG